MNSFINFQLRFVSSWKKLLHIFFFVTHSGRFCLCQVLYFLHRVDAYIPRFSTDRFRSNPTICRGILACRARDRLITYATCSLKLNFHPIISAIRLLRSTNWPVLEWWLLHVIFLRMRHSVSYCCVKCARNSWHLIVIFLLQCGDLLSPIVYSAKQTHALRHHTQVWLTPFGTSMVGDFWQSTANYRCYFDIFSHSCGRLDLEKKTGWRGEHPKTADSVNRRWPLLELLQNGVLFNRGTEGAEANKSRDRAAVEKRQKRCTQGIKATAFR